MEVIHLDVDNVQPVCKNLGLCLGYFDGVHLGHQTIIRDAMINNPGPVGVLTFDKAPGVITKKHKTEMMLSSLDDKKRYLSSFAVDYLFILHFDDKLMKMMPDQFILKILNKLKPYRLYCGSDYRFGAFAAGNVNLLRKYFNVSVTPDIEDGDGRISSTRIIHLIQDGKVKEASLMLGRYYEITGTVVKGEEVGREIGFPTANLSLDTPYVIPKVGVYSSIVYINGIPHLSMTNVGTHPTINQLETPIIEIYILDYQDDLYGKTVYLSFIDYLRDEEKFASLDDLKEQLKKDETRVRKIKI